MLLVLLDRKVTKVLLVREPQVYKEPQVRQVQLARKVLLAQEQQEPQV